MSHRLRALPPPDSVLKVRGRLVALVTDLVRQALDACGIPGPHEHCPYQATPPFQIRVEAFPRPVVTQQLACCRCGRVQMVYQGPEEPGGHGPHVTYAGFQEERPILFVPKGVN